MGTKVKHHTNNTVIRNALNTLIDLNPSKDNLNNAAKKALKFIFGINKDDKPGKRRDKNLSKEKDLPLEKKPPAEIVFVLESFLKNDTDTETKIAYLKKFASEELLKKIDELLQKEIEMAKEHEDKSKIEELRKYLDLLLCVDAEEEIEHQETIAAREKAAEDNLDNEVQSGESSDDGQGKEKDLQGLDGLATLIENFDGEKHGPITKYISDLVTNNVVTGEKLLDLLKSITPEEKASNKKVNRDQSDLEGALKKQSHSKLPENSRIIQLLLSIDKSEREQLQSAIAKICETKTKDPSYANFVNMQQKRPTIARS
jgi:hypothetical protein